MIQKIIAADYSKIEARIMSYYDLQRRIMIIQRWREKTGDPARDERRKRIAFVLMYGAINTSRACRISTDAQGSAMKKQFDYVNYRGEKSHRRVKVIDIHFGTTHYHGDKPQWLLEAVDMDKHEIRLFSMKDITNFQDV